MVIVEILPRFFLSDRENASCSLCLRQQGITHVLTIDTERLELKMCQGCSASSLPCDVSKSHVILKYHYALDVLNFNILQVLDKCLSFMETTLEDDKHKLLVHCLAGQSRSVVVACGYIMKKKGWSSEETLKYIRTKKADIRPNSSFVLQLALFHQMGYQVDVKSTVYKSFTTKITNMSEKERDFDAVNKYFLTCLTTTKELETISYKCYSCRQIVCTSKDFHPSHEASDKTCTSHYMIEPLEWLREQMRNEVQGKINCHKCKKKLGTFNWAGKTCSCGEWVIPSFQIHKSKVDAIRRYKFDKGD